MKKLTRILALMLAGVMVFALAGCGSSDSGSSDSGDASDGTVYNISFTIHDPSTSVKTQKYQELADATYEATDGKVNITIYSSGSLVASTDVAEAVLAGTADMGWLFTPFFSGQFPMSEIISMPMSFGDAVSSTKTLIELYETEEAIQEEFSQYKVFHIYTNPSNMIYSTEPVYSADDLAGLNIRCSGTIVSEMMTAWGGSPISMGPGDIYEAIEKGTLQGFILEWSGVKSFNLDEVISYVTDISFSVAPFACVMNLDTWNSLPAEYQEIMDEIWTGEDNSVALEFAELYEEDSEAGLQRATEEYGVEIITPTGDDYESFKEIADDYIASYTEKYDCADLYEHAVEIFAKYSE